ncbi:hypothetical protein AAHC03_05759 [Spirometra sp. Aus1]
MVRGPPCPAPSAYGGSPVGYYPPSAPSGHMHLRGGASDQPEYMDQQAPPSLPPETCVPMTSPIANPKQHSSGCFSMDTSGYASPCSEKNSSYMCGGGGGGGGIPPQTQSRQNPSSSSVNSLQPLPEVHQQTASSGGGGSMHHHQQPTSDEFMSIDEGRKPGVGGGACSDRWFSSAHMCLP